MSWNNLLTIDESGFSRVAVNGTLSVENRGKIGGERGERQPRLLVTAILLAKVALPTPE